MVDPFDLNRCLSESHKQLDLGDTIVHLGYLKEKELHLVREEAHYRPELLTEILLRRGLVTEEEMTHAVLMIMETIRNMAEEAGASPLAAALKIKDRLKGKRVALVLTGGNISLPRLKQILAD